MKPRRVVLTVEVKTDAPLELLRRIAGTVDSEDDDANARGLAVTVWRSYDHYDDPEILQISANVIREKKRKGKR